MMIIRTGVVSMQHGEQEKDAFLLEIFLAKQGSLRAWAKPIPCWR